MGKTIEVDFPAAQLCSCCHRRPAVRLCDFPVRQTRFVGHPPRTSPGCGTGPMSELVTCDRPICRECAIHLPGGIDVCPVCAARLHQAERRKELRGRR